MQNIAAYEALMVECVAFYDCIDPPPPKKKRKKQHFFSTCDLGETAKQEGLGNQMYLTGKQLKSCAAD